MTADAINAYKVVTVVIYTECITRGARHDNEIEHSRIIIVSEAFGKRVVIDFQLRDLKHRKMEECFVKMKTEQMNRSSMHLHNY